MTRHDFFALLYVYIQIELLTIEIDLSVKRRWYFFGDPAVLKLKGYGSASGRKVNM